MTFSLSVELSVSLELFSYYKYIMYRIAVVLVSIILPTFINCHAAKLGTSPSMLQMQGEMQIDVENVQKNVPFNTFCDWIGNLSYTDGKNFSGNLALALISIDGEIKEFIHVENGLHLSPGWGFGQWQRFCSMVVNVDLSDTDIIRFITMENGDDQWLPVFGDCQQTYCKVKGNEVVKSKINVNILGHNGISCVGYCEGTQYGAAIQYEPIYSSSYSLDISWPEGKDHRFVKVGPNLDRVQIDPDRILFQKIEKPEYTVTLMACSDDELITEQRHYVVKTPGSFGQQLKDDKDLYYINNISVSGRLNESDIAFMREEMPMLEHIDLSDADIEGGYLPNDAFNEKGIKSIILPKNLKGLGHNSLKRTKLFQLDIPAGVTYYGLNALNYSEDLTLVILRNPNVISVSWCVLNGINRSNGVLFVPVGSRDAFAADYEWGQFGQIIEGDNSSDYVSDNDGTYLYSGIYPNVTISEVINPSEIMIIPEKVDLKGSTFNVTGIGESAFSSYLIREIYIPKSIVSLGEYAISSTCNQLVKIEVDEGNKFFFSDGGVLYDRITSTMLTYPKSKPEREYTVPEGVSAIGGWACYSYYLNKITFPSTLKQIGNCAFCYSQFFHNPVIISKADNPPYLNYSAFGSSTYSNAKVYVPAKSLELYKSDIGWGDFFNIYPLDESSVEEVESDDARFTISGNTVIINSNCTVEIYGIDGKTYYKGSENSVTLPNGIFIIKINDMVKKIRI